MMAAIVAPAGVRSIARMRACLVSGRAGVFGDECADLERGLDLLVTRAAERVEALDFDLDLVMGSSEVMRRHPPHHLSPARAKPRQGKTPKRAFAPSSHHSNAPIRPVSQSNLSKIIALLTAIMASLRSVRIAFPLGRCLLLSAPQRGAERLALPGDPVDQPCCIQQRCCLIEQLLDVESYLKTLLMKARTGAGETCKTITVVDNLVQYGDRLAYHYFMRHYS
jgi:hypothetical protein